MKLDDRDIVAQQDYTPLSNAELLAHIETYAGLIYDMPLAERGRWQGDIVRPARVLLARAEAAEAEAYERLEAALFAEQRATDAEVERDDLRERHDNLKTACANLVQEAADRLTRMYSAEAEVARLRDAGRLVQKEVAAWRDGYRDLDEQRRVLAARVAELEAQLAAQGWRPVTAGWPPRNQRVVISAPGASWADVARKQHDGEEYVWQLKNGHVLDFESATVAIPLPPAPAPQEPTP